MPNQVLLEKYAKLIVEVGVNVQKNQRVVVRANTDSKELVREITKAAYQVDAKFVHVIWSDDYVSHDNNFYASKETLKEIPDYLVGQYAYFIKEGACFISITSPIPGLNVDLDSKKLQESSIASQQKLAFFREHTMGNRTQWVVAASANQVWAEHVFPKLKGEKALEALWHAIFSASRVTLDSDPVKNWKVHNHNLSKYNQKLNEYAFKSLHFKNNLGTDLVVELVENHIWAGGGETAGNKAYFNPNIPTEETFTMPYKWGTNGKVVATKPLNNQGKIIDKFWLEFKDGKVVDFDAKSEKEALKSILDFDDNSRYIGEIALISHDSPISNTNLLFLNTLFDENASCHMALGRAYPMNVKNGNDMTVSELEKIGYNNSMVHVDFMFGSSDMQITGTQKDGKTVLVFKDGNFVL